MINKSFPFSRALGKVIIPNITLEKRGACPREIDQSLLSVCLILVNVSFFCLTQQDKTYIILDKIYPIGRR